MLIIIFSVSFLWARAYYHPQNRENLHPRLTSLAIYFGLMVLVLMGMVIGNLMDAWSTVQKTSILLSMPAGILGGRLAAKSRQQPYR